MATKELIKMDAKEISKRVRVYFEETHGQFAVFLFQIDTVEPTTSGWQIKCSFLPSIKATEAERVNYKVIISASGEIKKVNRQIK